MNAADIMAYVKRKLGDNVVGVELTDDALRDCVDDAQLWYLMYKGQYKYSTLAVSTDTEYDVASDAEMVVEVLFPTTSSSIFDVFSWAGVQINIGDYFLTNKSMTYSGLVQYMQHLEGLQMIASADKDWQWDNERKKLIISPAPDSMTIGYVYLVDDIDMTLISKKDGKLIRDYALACAMETLGNIRTKYSDLPSAEGTFTMNGDTLISNAETLKMTLDDKIKMMREPLGFFAG